MLHFFWTSIPDSNRQPLHGGQICYHYTNARYFSGETCRNWTGVFCMASRYVSHYTNAPCGGSYGAMLLRSCKEGTFPWSFRSGCCDSWSWFRSILVVSFYHWAVSLSWKKTCELHFYDLCASLDQRLSGFFQSGKFKASCAVLSDLCVPCVFVALS